MHLSASAPGKLFLLGEYAVLEGAPALVAAVDRRAQVRLAPSPDDDWRLHAPDIGVADLALGERGRLPENLQAERQVDFAVYRAAQALCLDAYAGPAHRIEIDSRAFSQAGGKLGLGASAAVAAALTGALCELAGNQADPTETALQVHRRAQAGAGSGADVAAAVAGGVIEYRMGRPAVSLEWPQGLHSLAVITGRGTDTRQMLERIRAWRERAPGEYERHLRGLANCAADGARAWRTGDAGALVDLAADYAGRLEQLGLAAGAQIFTAAHERLRRLAQQAGAAFKPSGAGGGDLGLILADDPEAVTRLKDMLAEAGFEWLTPGFGAPGLRVSR